MLVTYRKANAEHQATTWADVRARVLANAQERRDHPAAKEKTLWRKISQVIPRRFQAEFEVKVEEVSVVRRGKPGKAYLPHLRVLPRAEARLKASIGRAAIIPDLPVEELSHRALVEAFVARDQIQQDFRRLKDRYVVSAKPFHVWHDATVPGHLFLCAMGRLLLRYLQWELRAQNLSMKELVGALEALKVVLVRTPEGRPKLVLEKMGRQEARLFEGLHLSTLVPA